MTVAELIGLLEGYDPRAVVLIPRDAGLGEAAEVVADLASWRAGGSSGPAAISGAAPLMGLLSPPNLLAAHPAPQITA